MTPSSASLSLADFQDRFADALLAGGDADGTPAAQPGFAIHRNTVMKGWVDALAANYPSVLRLVGDAFFRTAALAYARTNPTADPRLWCYGAGYADFLAAYAPASALAYLPGVARLDRYWTEAHGAARAPALDPGTLALLAPTRLAQCRLAPHPSARWAWFGGQPVYTLWRRNRETDGSEDGAAPDWQGEGALLLRPGANVTWRPLDATGCAFLDACAEGQPLGMAAAAALAANAHADIAALLAMLLQDGAFTATLIET
nr:DNA-binding domain-containing protein [uncultured Noviherbaspirillum sp.]